VGKKVWVFRLLVASFRLRNRTRIISLLVTKHMVATISRVCNFSFCVFQLCNISLSPRVRLSDVFFSVLQLFECLVVYKVKKKKKSVKIAKNPMLQNMSFTALHSVIKRQ